MADSLTDFEPVLVAGGERHVIRIPYFPRSFQRPVLSLENLEIAQPILQTRRLVAVRSWVVQQPRAHGSASELHASQHGVGTGYLDGWKEKDTRAAMLFGRAFEQALSAFFLREDASAALFKEWAVHQISPLEYSKGSNWDTMLHQGIQLLDRFAQDDRVRISQPRKNLQIKFSRSLSGNNDFVAYVDALGSLDGSPCLLEWKTTSSRYPEEPAGLLMLDPQLVCYSWITGISEVAQVAFVRKRLVEIQYFRTIISDEQRSAFGQLVDDTVRRIEAAQFLPHSGVRFPQNPCTSCPYVGLCLGRPQLVDVALVRQAGDDRGLFDELDY